MKISSFICSKSAWHYDNEVFLKIEFITQTLLDM